MPGLLDLFSNLDPVQSQSLLGAGMGMLNASGPSLMPHSLGQVMSAGYDGFQASQQRALDRQKEQMQMAMLQQQVAQATRKNELINNFLERGLSGSDSSQAAPAQPSMPQSLPMGSVDSDGRTISTPGFFAPADFAQKASAPPSQQPGTSGFGGIPSSAIAADLAFKNGEHIGDWINDRSKPVDAVKTAQQLGIPLSVVRDSQISDLQSKGITSVRPGGTLYQNGQPIFTAPTTEGQFMTWNKGAPTSTLVPGSADVNQALEYSRAAGKARAKPITAYDSAGKPVFTNEYVAANGGVDVGGPPSGVQQGRSEPMPGEPGFDVTNMSPTQKKAFYKQAEAQFGLRHGPGAGAPALTPSLAPGIEKSIGGNVDTMNSDFNDLYTANKNAPTTLALLDNIKKLAPAAITGSSADKLSYINGLLTLGGFQKQKDLAVATDLLNKNANMLAINMRLGASGGGSDALQSLAQAANPNNHMQAEAAIRAADEVIGQVRLKQTLYQQLLPFKMKNDVQGYYGAQQAFASKADPRAYQPDAQPAQAAAPAASAAPQKFDMLPPAAQFDGKRMRADNGTIYRSVGGKWVKE